ncbi:MAG: hypothetical protein GY754_36655 [bacterium]|nr:hypothetical protein [bacterium]
MKIVFDSYSLDDKIPVREYIKNRKLAKYFSRETAAAVVSAGKLLQNSPLSPDTAVYYAMGIVEYEDFGLEHIYQACTDEDGEFSQRLFIEKGMSSISPLAQFKVLYNMALSFISIEHNLKGENASVYSSASGLLSYALYSPQENPLLLGAGKVHKDGMVESGFALATKQEIKDSPFLNSTEEAINIFRHWHEQEDV